MYNDYSDLNYFIDDDEIEDYKLPVQFLIDELKLFPIGTPAKIRYVDSLDIGLHIYSSTHEKCHFMATLEEWKAAAKLAKIELIEVN